MASRPLLGNKVRRLRREQGLTQVEMAERLGISPSYLNLIEHNNRPLTLPLVLKLSRLFDVDLQTFSEDEEARLLADVTEVFGDTLFAEHKLTRADLEELVSVSTGISQAILTLYRAYRSGLEDVRALTERLTEDPLLSASSHELRTLLTSVRSFSEILHDNKELSDSERNRFLGIIASESERLTVLVEHLISEAEEDDPSGLLESGAPPDEVTVFLETHANHFTAIEEAADEIRAAEGLEGDGLLQKLSRYLEDRHGVTLEIAADSADEAPIRAHFDEEARRLQLPEYLPRASLAFRAAHQIGLLTSEAVFQRYISEGRFSSLEAGHLCRKVLANYFAGALTMPYEPFRAAAQELRHDIERLSARFGTSVEQVCHRLTTLQRPGATGVPLHFVRIDIAGNISKRFDGSGIRIPRYGGICPRWNVHAAFTRPNETVAELARMPNGQTFLTIARTEIKTSGGHGRPRSIYALGLGCDASYAPRFVYGDGLDTANLEAATPVGMGCRLCERNDCEQRAFPALISRSGDRAAPLAAPDPVGAAEQA